MNNHFEYVKSSGGIKEYLLPKNGMTVLIMEDHSAPVVTFMVTYRVGSRNEAVGHTGATHLLEHLMFKGSEKYNIELGNPIWTELQDVGAMINATTWLDRTNYFELLPKEHLEKAIAIESDRMRNAFLREEDRKPEMTVVRNEFEKGENDPFEALDKNIWATAYQAHPYHHSTIGWRSDIENVSTERLKQFYDTYYWPNNATVTLIGDFAEEKVFDLLYRYFGQINRSPYPIPKMYTSEPPQEGARRFVLKRPGQMGIVGIAHKTPEGTHKDCYTLQVLSKILGSGKLSRFYKAIVDKGLASDVYMWDYPFHDNGLFASYAFLTPGTEHSNVEQIILDEYEMIKSNGVSDDELNRAISKIRTDTAFSRDGSFAVAASLNEAIGIGEWTYYTTYLDNISSVTCKDIQKTAQHYLQDDQSTTGYFIPINAGKESSGPGPLNVHLPLYWRKQDTKDRNTENFQRNPAPTSVSRKSSFLSRVVDNEMISGIRVLTMNTGIKDVVTIQGSLLGGDVFNPVENSAAADLTASMLDQGTVNRNKFLISEELEKVGAKLAFFSTRYHVKFQARCLADDVPLVIELLAEQLRKPAFNREDLETTQKRKMGDLKRALENTGIRAMEKFLQTVYPKMHPNYFTPIEKQIADVEKLTIDDLHNFHNNYGTGSLIFVAVGDVNNSKINEAVHNAFHSWKQSPLKADIRKKEKANRLDKATSSYVTVEGKTSVDMVMGQSIGINRDHKDYYPLTMGLFILGGNFSSRLMATVRDKQGLTYGIQSSLSGVDMGSDGYWSIHSTFAPSLLKKGYKSTLTQLKKWIDAGVTKEEITAKKSTITGSYKVGLATTRGLASQILATLERGKEISFLDEFPDIINRITLNEVNSTIKKYCTVHRLITVSAGAIDKNGEPKSD